MNNLVPVENVAKAYNTSLPELMCIVKSMKLTLINLENVFLVNPAEFDFLYLAEDIFLPNTITVLDSFALD